VNSYAQAQQAYSPVTSPTRSARSVEYEVLARISYRMKKAIKSGDSKALAEAILENNKLWLAFEIDCLDDNNGLPDELRASIVSLAEFSRKHGMKVLAKQESAIPLLEVNAIILKGLKQEGPAP
jgi:flagellar protein FlaF